MGGKRKETETMGERESSCVKFFENVIEPKIKPSPLAQAGFDNADGVREALARLGIRVQRYISKPENETKKEQKSGFYRRLSTRELKRADEYIKANAANETLKEISGRLGVSKTTVRYKAAKLGVKILSNKPSRRNSRKIDDYILKNYKAKTMREIGKNFGITPTAVFFRANKLGVKFLSKKEK